MMLFKAMKGLLESESEMKKENCPQSENLVAYIYGEADESERKAFETHLTSCLLCDDELKAFGFVRESVIGWREDVLNNIVAPAFAREIVAKPARRRSALTAISEFFTLSPLWLRGATAFAAIVLIALIAFAAVQLFNKKSDDGVAEDKKIVTPLPEEPTNENNKKQEDNKLADNKIGESEDTTDKTKKVEGKEKKPITTNRKPQMATNKSPRKVNKKQQLSDEEILGYQMAYNEDDDSLRLSSINP